jgi:hypothetical protein
VDFKSKLVRRDKEGHSILIKQIINKEEIITVTLCEPNVGAPTFIKQIVLDLKAQKDSNTMITGEFITLL